MATGLKTYEGLAVPLLGEATIKQQTAADDILTMQGTTAQSGDFLVLRNVSQTELSYFDSNGAFNAVGAAGGAGVILGKGTVGQTAFARLRLPILETAPASAGLTKGDIWIAKATTDVYRFALCISTATGAARYGGRIIRTTLGTASH